MGPDSAILIDEMILPNTGASCQAMSLDFTMTATLSAMERTKSQWVKLLDSACLKVAKIYAYTESLRDSVQVVVAKWMVDLDNGTVKTGIILTDSLYEYDGCIERDST